MKNHAIPRLLALILSALCLLLFSSCNALASPPDASGAPADRKPLLSFDPEKGICAQSPDGNYRVCWNPISNAYEVKASAPWARGYALTYSSASKDYRATLPDGSAAVYKPGTGLRVEPPLPANSGKEPQRTALITFEWERWLCRSSTQPPAAGTA